MAYTAEISRSNPTAFIFLVDQSGSMSDKLSNGRTKAEQVSDVLNRTLAQFVIKCTKSEGTRDYFDIGIIGYGHNTIGNGLQGNLEANIINPISAIESFPLRVEDRKKKVDDGAGGVIEQNIKFPIWFEPHANGGTPMCESFRFVAQVVSDLCDAHPESYPPTILHVTDGESTDGNPEELASLLRQIKTNDGEVLLFNLHISSLGTSPIQFPSSEAELPDSYAKLLFRMSSLLPSHLVQYAQDKGFQVSYEARGMLMNADSTDIVDFFDIGTRAAQLR